MTGHTSLPMDVERPWLWAAGAVALLVVSVGAGYVVSVGGHDSVGFRVAALPADEPVALTVERETDGSFQRVHSATVRDSRETAWRATEPGYYRVTLSTGERSCTRSVVVEADDGRLRAVDDPLVDWSDCPATLTAA